VSSVARFRASEGLVERRKRVTTTHPELYTTTVRCTTCGNEFTTRSTRPEVVVDVCSSCHPAYTGIVREVARGSRIERFERRRSRAAA
jgi:large subunit ribosomal protein L31